MGDLIEILRQKAAGQRNKVGDLWADWVCERAADELARLRAEVGRLNELIASSAVVRLHYNGASREWSLSREEPLYLPNYDGQRVALVRLDAEEGK